MIRNFGIALVMLASLSMAMGQNSKVAVPVTTSVPPAAGGPKWSELPPAQQSALAPLKQHWAGIDASRKSKWIVVAQRFGSLPVDERKRVQARMAEWADMTPLERGRARLSFQELRSLPHDDRQALWDAYQALPDDKKMALAQRAKPVARAPDTASAPDGKRKVAVNPAKVLVKPVTPTLVQARPGATTTLVTKPPSPPVHHQPGLPKIMATDGFVNPTTLLPYRGPQGAATRSAAAASASPLRP